MTHEAARKLGWLIRRSRGTRGLSLRAVSKEAHVSYSWLGQLERGEMSAPAPSKLTRVAAALGVSLERIDRITRGQLSTDLPPMRTYFRAKYRLTEEEIERIEAVFDQIRRSRPGGELPG